MDACLLCLCCWLLPVVFLMIAIKYYMSPRWFSGKSGIMRNKTVIITGANTGIGLETASELARYGAHVIMACRDKTKAEAARNLIISRLQGQSDQSDIADRVIVEELDLCSLSSIRAFALRMLKTLPRLDVLINNAGVAFMSEKQLTKDNLEMTMGVNHFGHFLLTNLLLPILKKSAPSRIVVVSGDIYKIAKLDLNDLNSERSFGRLTPYANSKLANILFTKELARQLEGSGVVVNALHPGVILTELGRHFPSWFYLFYKHVLKFVYKTPLEGAQTTIYVAAGDTPDVRESGHYFRDCRVVQVNAAASDAAAAKKLWEVSERITKLSD